MTTMNHYRTRNRDQQDGVKRHVWGKSQHTDAGTLLTVRGAGTTDEEVPWLNTGYGFNFEENYNTEVMLVSFGSDTNQKYAIPSIPRDKQRPWKANTGGIQNPADPGKAFEFNPMRAHVREHNFALGDNGEVELKDGVLYIRCPIVLDGDLSVTGNLEVKGDLKVGGQIISDGMVQTPHVRSDSGSNNPDSANVNIVVPGFEDYNG